MIKKPFYSCRLITDCHGYNLLMTAIALIVVGLLSVAGMQGYTIYKKNQDQLLNQKRVAEVIAKIQTFKETYGRFPCPSSLNVARNSLAYGHEDCSTAIPVDTCVGGVCATQGRTIAPSVTPERIRIGGVPFRLLQIQEKEAYDAYGSRLVYAMTENLSNTATFQELGGAIGIVDENGGSLVDPPQSADYLVISPGPNRIGGFNNSGTQSIPCVAGTFEFRNCIDLGTPPASPTSFASSQAYLAGGATQFDDTIDYFASTQVARWRRNDNNLEDIQTIANDNVGLGILSPGVALDIAMTAQAPASAGIQSTFDGSLRVREPNPQPAPAITPGIHADSFCDEAGTACFRPENFSTTGMGPCPAGQYMIGIEGNGSNAIARCAPVRVGCQTGQVLTGINASGNAVCASVSNNCLLANIQVCNATYTAFSVRSSNEGGILNPTPTSNTSPVSAGTGIHGATINVFDPGAYAPNRAWARFTCNNGNWIKSGTQGGMCSCTPTPPPSSTCTTSPPSASCTGSGTCSGYATGSTSIPYTYNAATCSWSGGTPGIGTCTCPATPPSGAPGTVACPSGYNSGLQVPGYTWNSAPNICNWQAQASTCTCDGALAGSPPAGTQRACNTFAGYEGFSGMATPVFTFNSTAGACRWEQSSWDMSACTCDTTTLFPENTTSTCNASCENETTPAKNWYKYTLPGCVKTLDSTTPSVCGPKSFTWQLDPNGGTIPSAYKPGTHEMNSACNLSCTVTNQVGATSGCWRAGTNSTYISGTCTCNPFN